MKAVENQEGWHGKPLDDPEAAIEELGGLRNIVVEVAKPRAGRAARLRDRPARAAAVRGRLGGRDPQGVRRGARGGRRRRAATSSRSTARSRTRPSPRSSRRRTRIGSSRCTSPSSRWPRRRSGSRRAATACSRRRSPRSIARSYDFVRMAAISRATICLCRLARRDLDRRGRPVADGARGHRLAARGPRLDRAPSLRRELDREARRGDGRPRRDLLPADAAPEHAGALRAGRGVPDRRHQRRCARATR